MLNASHGTFRPTTHEHFYPKYVRVRPFSRVIIFSCGRVYATKRDSLSSPWMVMFDWFVLCLHWGHIEHDPIRQFRRTFVDGLVPALQHLRAFAFPGND